MTDRRAFEPAPEPPDTATSHEDLTRTSLLRESIHRAIAAGAGWIQIREKDLGGRSLVELVRFAVAETRATAARVLVNDRLDVALAANAAGVHLGEKSLPLEVVCEWRRSAGRPDFLIGVSCHSLESARAAERGRADYIFFGPVYATPSKAGYGAPQGVERLREVCASVAITSGRHWRREFGECARVHLRRAQRGSRRYGCFRTRRTRRRWLGS